MNIRHIYEHSIYHLLATFSLSVVFILFVKGMLELDVSESILIVLCVMMVVFYLLGYIVGKRLVFLGILSGICGVILLVLQWIGQHPFQWIFDAAHWTFSTRDPLLEQASAYALLTMSMLAILGSVISYLITGLERIRFVMSLLLLVSILFISTMQLIIPRNIIYMVILFLLMAMMERYLKGTKSRNSTQTQEGRSTLSVTHLLPMLVLLSGIIAFLPVSEERIPFDRFFQDATDFIVRSTRRMEDLLPWGDHRDFRVNMTGYSDNPFFGGSLLDSNQEALFIQGSTRESSLYLAGSYLDTFLGNRWVNQATNISLNYPEHQLRLLEFLIALEANTIFDQVPEETLDEILQVRQLRITYADIRTRSIFHPPLIASLFLQEEYEDEHANIVFLRNRTTDTSYQLNYLAVNYAHPVIQEMFRNPVVMEQINLDQLEYIIRMIPGREIQLPPLSDTMLADLVTRREHIFLHYLDVPLDTSPQLIEFARTITYGANNDYEAMLLISHFFGEQGYQHTKTPPPLPDRDFTMWFLTEVKEGYCTYFATAAAMLGRSLGIPVRLVQGFARYQEQAQSTSIITHNHAHSWIEAYIMGIGWMPFEPTPKREMAGGTFARSNVIASIPVTRVDREDIERLRLEREEELLQRAQEEEQLYRLFTMGLVIGFLVLIVSVVAVILILYIRSQARYKKSNRHKVFLLEFQTILFLLELQKQTIETGETIREYEQRLEVGDIDRNSLCDLLRRHEGIVYNTEDIHNKDIDCVIGFRRSLAKRLPNRKDQIRYFRHLVER